MNLRLSTMVRKWIYPFVGKRVRKEPPMNKCCFIGDPVLSQKCEPINWSEDGLLLKRIVYNLKSILCSQKLRRPRWKIILSKMVGKQLPLGFTVGLSAPQIGIPKRVFALHLPREYMLAEKQRGLNHGEPLPFSVFVNPKMKIVDNSKINFTEGCVSVPHMSGTTSRYSEVRLEATDENGKATKLNCKGFLAVVVQHEMDHLDGRMYLERLTSFTSLSHHWWPIQRKGFLLHSELPEKLSKF